MTFPEWTKPGLYGALGGAIAVCVLGFAWGGWTTSGSAQEMAEDLATEKVTMALVPVCLDQSASDPERAAKLTVLREASRFNRSKEIIKTGWATMPGTDEPNRAVAKACVEGLDLDGS